MAEKCSSRMWRCRSRPSHGAALQVDGCGHGRLDRHRGDYRLEVGRKWGADHLFNTKEVKSKHDVKDLKEAISEDKEIRFSWLAPLAWPTAIHAVSEGLVKVEPLVTGTVPLIGAAKAIRDWKEREGDPVKVQVTP